jgi:predicted outer membrane repeat protein
LSQATFTDNRAASGGGAISSGVVVRLTNCVFRRNSIEGSGGGAIDAASVTADHSVFENNHAGHGGLGGAIAAGKLSVDSASFVDNGRHGSGEGGAIFVAGLSGADTVTDSNFVGNKAQTGGAIGASVPSLTLTNTDFASNEASQGGGAVAMSPLTAAAGNLVLEAGHYFKNRAGGFGGAVLGSGNSTDIYRTNFHGNVAQSGGAIAQTTGKLIMLDGDVNSNEADRLGGGGIRVGSGATATLTDTTLFVNRSFQIDGVSPYPVPGGGLLNLGPATVIGGLLIGNDPDDCAGSGTTTGC